MMSDISLLFLPETSTYQDHCLDCIGSFNFQMPRLLEWLSKGVCVYMYKYIHYGIFISYTYLVLLQGRIQETPIISFNNEQRMTSNAASNMT